MKNMLAVFFPILIYLSGCVPGEKTTGDTEYHLMSPDSSVMFIFRLDSGIPRYTVSFKGQPLVENSALGFTFRKAGDFIENLEATDPVFREIDETYELVVGKAKNIRNHCREMVVRLKGGTFSEVSINLTVRAYNDGVAFRYDFPEQKGFDTLLIERENTSFHPIGNPKMLTLFLPGFTTSHEGLYSSLNFSDVKEDTLMDVPVLFDFDKTYMAVTEAALLDYAGMYLVKRNDILQSELSPLPGQKRLRVKASLPHKTPWRVLMISDRIGDLFESNILTNLCEPSRFSDTSWLRPGKATWPWWNGTVVGDPNVKPGNNFETNKYYIDFCARNGIEYHSVVEYGGHEWYVNDGEDYMPGPGADPTKPVDGLDMQQVCDYARSKGVGVRVWAHWAALWPKMEEAFIQYEKWGIDGLMIDFMDRDDQEMVNMQTEMLERAAEYHLHVQFHGAYKPTGLHRTYPNEFTREGTLNYEVCKWDTIVTPDHDLDIIYARMLAGASDYHLGGFRAVPKDQFTVRFEKPSVIGTRCHMLGMFVVLESYLGLVCDYPEAYEGQPGFGFVTRVPTVWDETRFLNGQISEYITLARRKGPVWFVGSVNNSTERKISLPFDFLPQGEYVVEIYSDCPETAKDANRLKKQTRTIKPGDTVNIQLASGGGAAAYIKSNSSD